MPAPVGSDLERFAATKPNRKALGLFRYNMWLYLWNNNPKYDGKSKKVVRLEGQVADLKKRFEATPESDTKTYNYLKRRYRKREKKLARVYQRREQNRRTVWERPAILDSLAIVNSLGSMKRYLVNKGYFHADVGYEVDIHRQKAKITYIVLPGDRFYVRTISLNVPDEHLLKLTHRTLRNSSLREKRGYDGDQLSTIRDSLTTVFRNNGYYNFNKNYIYYEVDTALKGDSVKISLGISNPVGQKRHPIYRISEVYVLPNFKPGQANDTFSSRKEIDGIIFLQNEEKIKPKVLVNNIFFRPGRLYRYRQYQNTMARLSNLQQFRFTDITFEEDSVKGVVNDTNYLKTFVRLDNLQKQEIGYDLEVNTMDNSQSQVVYTGDRSLGSAVTLIYRNRNVARSAVQFETRLRGAIELPFAIFSDTTDVVKPNYLLGFTNSLIFPKLLFFDRELQNKAFGTQLRNQYSTAINLNFIYENNSDFLRFTSNTNLTYQIQARKLRYFIIPVEFSLVNTTYRTEEFKQTILDFNDPVLLNLFEPHIITDGKFQVLYNQQPLQLVTDPMPFLKFTFEVGGNSMRLLDKLIEAEKNKTEREPRIFGVQYFQYVKAEWDARYYFPTTPNTNLAVRGLLGLGYPYGGNRILPFERRFFIGGANSVRAWRLRSLGPGSYKPENRAAFDRSGDMKIEGSVEYRFPLVSIFKGAFFVDAGNVWTYNVDQNRPGADFKFDRFYKEFAVGGGFGLRLDLSIFVFRLDLGVPLRDPSLPNGERLVWQQGKYKPLQNSNLQLGVGYPF